MDHPLCGIVSRSHLLPDFRPLRLYLQHGRECRRRIDPKHHVDLVLRAEISKSGEVMGGVAGSDCVLVVVRHEFGIVRFPAVVGHVGCACVVAFGNCGADHLVV